MMPSAASKRAEGRDTGRHNRHPTLHLFEKGEGIRGIRLL